MLQAAEKKEIIDAFRYEFKTFKDDTFKPIADSVKANTDKTADQGEDISRNCGDIKTLKSDVKENRGSIGRLLFIVVGGLVSILATFLTIWITG